MDVATWCGTVCSTSFHYKDSIYLHRLFKRLCELSAFGFRQQSRPWQQLLWRDSHETNSRGRGESGITTPEHCHDAPEGPATVVKKQPRFTAFQIRLLCSCHLFLPKCHGSQKSTHQAKQLLKQEARMPLKLLGAESKEKQDLCGSFSQDKED